MVNDDLPERYENFMRRFGAPGRAVLKPYDDGLICLAVIVGLRIHAILDGMGFSKRKFLAAIVPPVRPRALGRVMESPSQAYCFASEKPNVSVLRLASSRAVTTPRKRRRSRVRVLGREIAMAEPLFEHPAPCLVCRNRLKRSVSSQRCIYVRAAWGRAAGKGTGKCARLPLTGSES